MPSVLVRALSERARLPLIDETNIDAFLAPAASEPDNAVLFFTGDPSQRPEADDVAVVLPHILQTFQGRLRGAVVLRTAEDKLKARFNVVVMPSLAVTRRDQPVGVLGKIRDWSEYVEKISAWLAPAAPVMVPSGGPKVEITHAGKEIVR
ncbi:hydrogenase accessory protein (plasmid) [Mesorhizobium sp. AR07]|uniref:hydrogenase accessory protein n=1 Tax=Mesorhizobium sp. AR07 TaxID=2865838 RepID=UPI00215E4324|nr:hydrogenase accessory protein [Mesorhizobium sp. AR07]UVK48607.1 hydrogenase accessory protein [Mesorhizobium sp. AR07]